MSPYIFLQILKSTWEEWHCKLSSNDNQKPRQISQQSNYKKSIYFKGTRYITNNWDI